MWNIFGNKNEIPVIIKNNVNLKKMWILGLINGCGKIENDTIYVGGLKTGTFLIEVSNGTLTSTKRFIKE